MATPTPEMLRAMFPRREEEQEIALFNATMLEIARRAYAAEAERERGRLTPLRVLEVVDHRRDAEYAFHFDFHSGFNWHVHLPYSRVEGRSRDGHRLWRVLCDETRESYHRRITRPRRGTGGYAVFRIFAEALEDVQLDLEVRHIRAHVAQLYAAGADNEILRNAQLQAAEAIQRLQEHRNARSGGQHSTATEVCARQPNELFSARVWNEQLAQNMREDLLVFSWDLAGDGGSKARKEAQERGLKLLRENLTTEQLAEYDAQKHFHVIGGETGTRYRILHGRQINIRQLNAKGEIVAKLCFLPAGNLVEGDVMLAQKLALELQESEALKVANRFPPDGEYAGMEATMTFVDGYQQIRLEVIRPEQLYNSTFPTEEPRGPVRAPTNEELRREREMYRFEEEIVRRSPNSHRR